MFTPQAAFVLRYSACPIHGRKAAFYSNKPWLSFVSYPPEAQQLSSLMCPKWSVRHLEDDAHFKPKPVLKTTQEYLKLPPCLATSLWFYYVGGHISPLFKLYCSCKKRVVNEKGSGALRVTSCILLATKTSTHSSLSNLTHILNTFLVSSLTKYLQWHSLNSWVAFNRFQLLKQELFWDRTVLHEKWQYVPPVIECFLPCWVVISVKWSGCPT